MVFINVLYECIMVFLGIMRVHVLCKLTNKIATTAEYDTYCKCTLYNVHVVF